MLNDILQLGHQSHYNEMNISIIGERLAHREKYSHQWKWLCKILLAKKGLFQSLKMYYLIELDSGLMDLFPF